MFDGRVDHAGHPRIHSERRVAVQDVVQIGDRHVLADVTILGRRLEFELFLLRNGLLRGQRHQFAEAQLAIGFGMHHLVILGLAFGNRHAPLRRRRAFEHHARGGAGFAHRIVEIANRFRTVGVLATVFLVTDGLFDLDALPIGFQFFGDNHGQRGANARAHFRTVRDDDHAAVGFQAQIDAGLPGGIAGRCCSGLDGENARAQYQRAGGKYATHKIAAADDGNRSGLHAFRLHAFTPAAIFTACRIR